MRRILASIWVIVATVIWATFFFIFSFSGPLSELSNRAFNWGYAWMAVGIGGLLLNWIWKPRRP